jgi:hypothetical protein
VHIYDATLWVVGDRWTPDQPHAIDLESGRDVPANTLVGAAIDEMRKLKMGDEAQLKLWSEEMKRLLPPVRSGDQVVLFCSSGRTVIAYYNGQERGEINDPHSARRSSKFGSTRARRIRSYGSHCSTNERRYVFISIRSPNPSP